MVRSAVSMKDVAALAGVSVGTVSNVLNAPNLVSPATRERVETAIAKLGWVRNESARQLRAGRSRSIGMIVLDLSNPFFTDIAEAAEEYVQPLGYTLQLGNTGQRVERERAHLALFEQARVRGLLLAPLGEVGGWVEQLRRRGIPTVLVDRVGSTHSCCSVSVDDVEGGRLAVQHLIDEGYERIAFVGGPSTLRQVKDRRLGAQLATAGLLAPSNLLTISTPFLSTEAGAQAAEEVVAMPDHLRPTAVFAANDLVAIGLLQGFVTHGLRVPDDVALIGYDDIGFAAAAAVPLSSVRQPRDLLGRKAAELLFDEVDALENESHHEHQQVQFEPELVVRRSTLRTREGHGTEARRAERGSIR